MSRTPPQIQWRSVLIGGAVAFLLSTAVAMASSTVGSSALLVAATPVGLAAGGAVAGRLSRAFGLLQGGMVGVLWVLAEAISESFGAAGADVLAEVALVLFADVIRIGIAAAAGWLGGRSVSP